jgi:hypothetical protein
VAELLWATDLGIVEQGAQDRGDRDALDGGAILGIEPAHVVYANALLAATAPSGNRHVDGAAGDRPQVAQGGRGSVAQDCVRTARQHGRHPTPSRGQAPMPDRVDAPVETVKATALGAPPDGTRAEAERRQLPVRDNSVLPSRQLGDLPVTWMI